MWYAPIRMPCGRSPGPRMRRRIRPLARGLDCRLFLPSSARGKESSMTPPPALFFCDMGTERTLCGKFFPQILMCLCLFCVCGLAGAPRALAADYTGGTRERPGAVTIDPETGDRRVDVIAPRPPLQENWDAPIYVYPQISPGPGYGPGPGPNPGPGPGPRPHRGAERYGGRGHGPALPPSGPPHAGPRSHDPPAGSYTPLPSGGALPPPGVRPPPPGKLPPPGGYPPPPSGGDTPLPSGGSLPAPDGGAHTPLPPPPGVRHPGGPSPGGFAPRGH